MEVGDGGEREGKDGSWGWRRGKVRMGGGKLRGTLQYNINVTILNSPHRKSSIWSHQ